MDPEKYSRALKAIKFNRMLSPEEVRPFLAAYDKGEDFSLQTLRDKLRDEEDPATEVWDRDFDARLPHNWTSYERLVDPETDQQHRLNLAYSAPEQKGHPQAERVFRFFPVSKTGSQPAEAVQVFHRTSSNYKKYPGAGVDLSHWGIFTPAEVRKMADKFPEQHSEQLHKFLDQHFPQTEQT